MFSWLEGLVSSIASSIGGVFEGIGDTIVNAIWDNLVKWLFNAFYDSIADVFTQMGDMGAEIFDLTWIESAVHLFFPLRLGAVWRGRHCGRLRPGGRVPKWPGKYQVHHAQCAERILRRKPGHRGAGAPVHLLHQPAKRVSSRIWQRTMWAPKVLTWAK